MNKIQWFGTDTWFSLDNLQQFCKKVKIKIQKVFGADWYVCRSYRQKTDRVILNRVKLKGTYSGIMSNRKKGRLIRKEFTIQQKVIWQNVYKNQKQMSFQKFWPFNSTFCFRYFRKSLKTYNKFPYIPLPPNFRISPSCQILWKVLDMSKNTSLTLTSLSRDWHISLVIERSWFM